nr:unnamed protein product [Digitaria exilis]
MRSSSRPAARTARSPVRLVVAAPPSSDPAIDGFAGMPPEMEGENQEKERRRRGRPNRCRWDPPNRAAAGGIHQIKLAAAGIRQPGLAAPSSRRAGAACSPFHTVVVKVAAIVDDLPLGLYDKYLFCISPVDLRDDISVQGLIEEYLERSGWQPQGRKKFLVGPQKLLREYDASQMYAIFNL